ncbi:MAG TPA: arginyltransferase [Gammaproteobacteria bacterium]|nr:arginyltransferase [Gammaproteobacteria bacterium]
MHGAQREGLELYLSPEHPCAYLPERLARTAFVGPKRTDAALYSTLAPYGFRRSGPLVYRPDCVGCRACIPVRIPVADFTPDRGQRRVWRRNRDLTVRLLPAEVSTEHFELYRRYLEARHAGGGMDQSTEADYYNLIASPWGKSLLAEMRAGDELMAVAVMDELRQALSAVYSFYAPAFSRRSLGTYAILWQIAEAQRRGFEWLYLGYWIAASPKMAYKDRFRPFERLDPGGWTRVP